MCGNPEVSFQKRRNLVLCQPCCDGSTRWAHSLLGPAQSQAAAAASEVVVLATQHFISDMPDGFTPGHLRALLPKIKPDVVAVEAPTNAPDPWSMAPYDGDYHLFHGKLLLHQGKFAEAEEEFAKLGESSGNAVLAFDGQSRLGEAGQVYAAIAKSRQGKVDEARADFDAILALPDTTPASRQWLEQLKLELAAVSPPDAGGAKAGRRRIA